MLNNASNNIKRTLNKQTNKQTKLSSDFSNHPVLSKYFRVLSDIGLTEFQILSDQTKILSDQTFYKAYC